MTKTEELKTILGGIKSLTTDLYRMENFLQKLVDFSSSVQELTDTLIMHFSLLDALRRLVDTTSGEAANIKDKLEQFISEVDND